MCFVVAVLWFYIKRRLALGCIIVCRGWIGYFSMTGLVLVTACHAMIEGPEKCGPERHTVELINTMTRPACKLIFKPLLSSSK
jgi:hypothetical protein